VRIASVEWTLGKDPGVLVEVYTTESLLEAVLGALLEDPAAMAKAMKLLKQAA